MGRVWLIEEPGPFAPIPDQERHIAELRQILADGDEAASGDDLEDLIEEAERDLAWRRAHPLPGD